MRDRGLSMVEVVVAMMVFAVGICSAVSVGYVATHWGGRARAEMEASRLARAVFDYVKSTEPLPASSFESPQPGFDFESPVALSWRVQLGTPDSLGLRLVTITVFRETGEGPESVAVFNALLR